MRKFIVYALLFCLFILLLFYFASKPNIGGVEKCEKMLGIERSSFGDLKEKEVAFPWEFSYLTRYAFYADEDFIKKIESKLTAHGYSPWKEGNLNFDGKDVAAGRSCLMSQKNNNFLIYDVNARVLHVVRQP